MRWTLARILFIAAGVGLAWYVWLSWLGALPQYKHEALIEGTLMLYMLIFPSSVLFGFIFAALTIITPIDQINAGNAFLNWMFTTWGPMVIFGYCQ
ncbi:MAG: hypothetical protein LBE22_03075, partial [Azoarcus sp.]|nr:hypothetical protein [Azoarcus sp.]